MSEKIKMGIISDTHGLLREEVKEPIEGLHLYFPCRRCGQAGNTG